MVHPSPHSKEVRGLKLSYLGRGHLARFQALLEAAQVLVKLLPQPFTTQAMGARTQLSRPRRAVQHQIDHCSSIPRTRIEVYRTGMVFMFGAPGDQFICPLIDDLDIGIERGGKRTGGARISAAATQPGLVGLLRRTVDEQAGFDLEGPRRAAAVIDAKSLVEVAVSREAAVHQRAAQGGN